jgi:hypothetical protein
MLREDWRDFNNELSKLIARSWIDNQYREILISHPEDQLRAAGLSLPEGVAVQVDESSYFWRIEQSINYRGATLIIGLPPQPYNAQQEQEEQLRVVLERGVEGLGDFNFLWCCCG